MKWMLTYCGFLIAECKMLGYSRATRNLKSEIRSFRPQWQWVLALIIALSCQGVIFAQDNDNPEEVKKNLADAMNQLKAAQDRKNELATENEALKTRVAELEKQLNDQKQKTADLEDKTWFWRSHYFAWTKFIERYPLLLAQWKLFMDTSPLQLPNLLPVWDEPVTSPPTIESPATQKVEGAAKAAGE